MASVGRKLDVEGMAMVKDVKGLIEALNDEDWVVRAEAAIALGEIGDTRAVAPLTQALKDEHRYVRAAAAIALGRIKDGRAVAPLIQALKDRSYRVRAAAAIALAMIKDGRAVAPLIQALKDEDPRVQGAAKLALEGMAVRAVAPLIQALKDEHRYVRAGAAIALGEIGDTRAVAPLTQALKDESASVRNYASEALALISAIDPSIEMTTEFRFDNYSRHVGSRGEYEWFEWKVFMDEPPEKLGKVRSVEYGLHKTFPNPIRIVEDPKSQFALRSAGWGEFWIFITIYLKDGREEHTKYYLDLGKPWPADDQ